MSEAPAYTEDTIVAAATPPGAGGIGIVRMSGPQSDAIAEKIAGVLPPPRVATFAVFADSAGEAIDHGLVLRFAAPKSFTGEYTVELHCHGGPLVVNTLIDTAIALGARRAEPGEFSKRAYLNDKLDLAQAEAIADLIGSGSRQAAKAALRSLSGAFSAAVIELQQQLTNVRMHTEAALDFPEEEIDFLTDGDLLAKLESCELAFEWLLEKAQTGRLLRDGIQAVIVGRPNAGKSSLLNCLSGEDTAIVTEVAGTTRDILREKVSIDGVTIELVDTAGLRDNPDTIEAEGIRRARAAMAAADVILWIRDASDDVDESLAALEPAHDGTTPVIGVRNKIDLTHEAAGTAADGNTINLCALSGEGSAELLQRLRAVAGFNDTGEGAFTARRRHLRSIETAFQRFRAGRQALVDGGAGELLAEELKLAQQALGDITGEFTSDDLLGKIFSEFCIGK